MSTGSKKRIAGSWEDKVTGPNGTSHARDRVPPYLVFFASSTPEKERDLQFIAERKNLPIHFIDIRKLVGAFHSIDEKGQSYRANALDKLKEIDQYIERYRENPEAIQQFCQNHNIAFDPARIFFATEDTGFSLEKPVWNAVRPSLETMVPKEVFDRIDEQLAKDHSWGGPGVETGPVLSAVLGPRNLMEITLAAIEKELPKVKQVSVFEKSTLTMRRLDSRPTEPSLVIPGEVRHYLYKPKDIDSATGRIGTHHFLRRRDVTDKSLVQEGEDFILKNSPRASVIDTLAKKLKLENPGRSASKLYIDIPEPFKVGFFPDHLANSDHVKIVSMLESSNGNHKGRFAMAIPDSQYYSDFLEMEAGDPAKVSSRSRLSGIEEMVKESDAMVLLPDMRDDPNKPATADPELARFEKLYTLFSLVVAKQLIHRDAAKPILILNHDGSWDDAIAVHNSLANANLTKELNIPLSKTVNDAAIASNGYFDVIRGKTYADTVRTAIKLLSQEREHYERQPELREEEFDGGMKPEDHPGFKVGIFCSASSENKVLNESVEALSYALAKDNFGIVYGGGDRYTMGAVLDGVRRYRHELVEGGQSEEQAQHSAWIGGYSTRPILVSETKRAHFPEELSYYRQTENIYHRMADMLEASDAVVVAPGGAGTVQEWSALLMLKKQAPERFQHKAVVIYNPVLFTQGDKLSAHEQKVWDTTLKVVLGDDYALLSQDPAKMGSPMRMQYEERCHQLGIYIETDAGKVKERLDNLRESYDKVEKTDKKRGFKERWNRGSAGDARPSERTIAG